MINRKRTGVALGVTAGLLAGGAAGMVLGAPALSSATGVVQQVDDETDTTTDDTTTDDTTTDDTTTDDTTTDENSEVTERGTRLRELLEELVPETISAEQADAVTELLVENAPERRGGRGGPGGHHHRGPGLLSEALLDTFGLDADEVRSQLREGSTLAEVLVAEGVDVETFVDTLVEEATERLDQAVENGRIDAEEAAERAAEIEERIRERVNEALPEPADAPLGD